MSIPEEIGRNVAFLRKVANVSREWLSLESGVAQSYLYEIEYGRSNPTVEILARIANALDVPFELLFVEDLPKQFGPVVASQEYTGQPINLQELIFLLQALDRFRKGSLRLEE